MAYHPKVQDIGAVYCGIAGMLNLLVMFDVLLRITGSVREDPLAMKKKTNGGDAAAAGWVHEHAGVHVVLRSAAGVVSGDEQLLAVAGGALVLAISIVYKCTRIEDVRKLPAQAVIMTGQVLIVMVFTAVLLAVGISGVCEYGCRFCDERGKRDDETRSTRSEAHEEGVIDSPIPQESRLLHQEPIYYIHIIVY